MNELLAEYLDKMLDMEEKGYGEQALALANHILEAFPDEKAEVLLEKAKLEFRNGYIKEALVDFIKVYELSENAEIYDLILEAYYQPNEDVLQETFQHNIELLEKYPYDNNDHPDGELKVIPIWQDDYLLICADVNERQFQACTRTLPKELPKKGNSPLLVNEMWMDDILLYEENSGMPERFMNMELPLYLVFDREYWMLFAQLYDIEPLLQKNRIVILIGEHSFFDYFCKDRIGFPDWQTALAAKTSYAQMLVSIQRKLDMEVRTNIYETDRYYENNMAEILARFKEHQPRILFLTCRHTTVLQYHTRDCMQAAARLGCATRFVIEQNDIEVIKDNDLLKEIAEFKPDMIFCIDHFRFKRELIPKQIVWLTWIQDPLAHIMDKNTPAKLTDKDFIMNHFITWKKVEDVGYDKNRMMEAPVPANERVYHPYPLSEEEIETYGCDICFVCHAADVDAHIQEILEQFPKELREPLCAIYKGYQAYAYESGEFFYAENVFAQYIEGAFKQNYGITLRPAVINYLARDMYTWFNQRVYRQTLVDWLLDAGFRNIKLWGNGWTTDEKYKDYAMGPAENGEVLSKVYQAAKIVIGNNVNGTGAARAWEAMLSGSFYMSNYVPPEEDVVDIRKIMTEGENLIMFYSKQDLLDKIGYYLVHEEERKQIAKKGNEMARKYMTYDALINRVLAFLAEKVTG